MKQEAGIKGTYCGSLNGPVAVSGTSGPHFVPLCLSLDLGLTSILYCCTLERQEWRPVPIKELRHARGFLVGLLVIAVSSLQSGPIVRVGCKCPKHSTSLSVLFVRQKTRRCCEAAATQH